MNDPCSVLGDPAHRAEKFLFEAAWRFQLLAPLLDSRLTKSERQTIRERLLAESHPHPWRGQVPLSERTLRRWLALYRQQGLRALATHGRKDHGCSRVLSAETQSFLLELLGESARRTVEKLKEHLETRFPELRGKIFRSTLDRHVRKLRSSTIRPKAYLQFEAAHANDMWQGDILHGPMVSNGEGTVRAKLVCWIDDHSRYICHLEAFSDERLPALEASLKRAILKHGLPSRLFVDNGKVYSCKSFGLACSQLGIHKMHAAPYHPESKGKVERFFRTLRQGLLDELELVDPIPLDRLNRLLAGWLHQYHHREHSSLQATPAERFQPILRMVSLSALEESFWQWETRSVSPQGLVTLEGNLYQVDLSLVGQQVIVRYDPYDLARIHLWRDGRVLATATPESLLHRSRPRKEKTTSPRRSDAAEKLLQALEKTYLERTARELNLIQLPGSGEEP